MHDDKHNRLRQALQRTYSMDEAATALDIPSKRLSRLLPRTRPTPRISLADLLVLSVLNAADPSPSTAWETCTQAVTAALQDAHGVPTEQVESAMVVDGRGEFQVATAMEAITGDWASPTQVWFIDNQLEAIFGRLDGDRRWVG